jgi:hypothetical protein
MPNQDLAGIKLREEKLIEFLWKSSLKSLPAMLDALRYLDGKWVQEEARYEVFDEALGEKPAEAIQIRVPQIRGIPANALLAFVVHAQAFDLIRRRSKTGVPHGGPEEIIALYESTPVGSYVVKVLEILTDITARG